MASLASGCCIRPHRIHNISIITESPTELCQVLEDPEGCTRISLTFKASTLQSCARLNLIIYLRKIAYSFQIIKYDWNWEPIRLFITIYAPGHCTKMFRRQCFLIAYLALLNILSILLLMSSSLTKMKIHASYSWLFTQHSLSFTQKGRRRVRNQWFAI